MTAAEIAKDFAGWINSTDPEWVAKLGNQLEERIEALVAGEVSEAKAAVQRLAAALALCIARLSPTGNYTQLTDNAIYVKAAQVLASIPAHLLAKEPKS